MAVHMGSEAKENDQLLACFVCPLDQKAKGFQLIRIKNRKITESLKTAEAGTGESLTLCQKCTLRKQAVQLRNPNVSVS